MLVLDRKYVLIRYIEFHLLMFMVCIGVTSAYGLYECTRKADISGGY